MFEFAQARPVRHGFTHLKKIAVQNCATIRSNYCGITDDLGIPDLRLEQVVESAIHLQAFYDEIVDLLLVGWIDLRGIQILQVSIDGVAGEMNDLVRGVLAVVDAVADDVVDKLGDVDSRERQHDGNHHQADRDYQLDLQSHGSSQTRQSVRAELSIGSFGQVAAVRTVLLQFVVQSLQADAENLCSSRLVVARARQRAQNELLFCFFDGRAYAKMDRVRIQLCGSHLRGAEARRQVFRLNDSAAGKDNCALDRVPQFAYVSRPTVGLKRLHHRVVNSRNPSSMLLVQIVDKRFHQIGQIFLVLAQGRHVNVENVQAIVQVISQLPCRYRFFRNLVGCR